MTDKIFGPILNHLSRHNPFTMNESDAHQWLSAHDVAAILGPRQIEEQVKTAREEGYRAGIEAADDVVLNSPIDSETAISLSKTIHALVPPAPADDKAVVMSDRESLKGWIERRKDYRGYAGIFKAVLKLIEDDDARIGMLENKCELLEEDIECMHTYLSDQKAPIENECGKYSVVGRIIWLLSKGDAKLVELERELAQIKDPLIKHLRLENGEFNMAVGGLIVEHMGAILIAWFRSGGAQNYVEMSFHEKVEPFNHFTLNMQCVEGKTPHQLRDIAEKRAVMLEEALAKAAKAFRWYESIHTAKPDVEKAKRNADYAVMCEAAIESSGLMQPQPAEVK
jgi:hypothetical protein